MSPLARLGLAAAVCLALQAVAFVGARRLRNWALVDPCWAACVTLAAALHAALGPGDPARRGAVAALAAVWGVRHVVLLLRHRVIGRPEEGRYVELRARWSPAVFLGFFLAQGLLAALLSAPFLLAASDPAPFPGPFDVAAAALAVVGLAGEALADAQLAAWKRDPAHAGRTCRAGLWAWSRHPNYFFELVVWTAFAVLATPAPLGALAWSAPALLGFLIVRVTGIPPSEAQALRSRGDDYRRYQREVPALVPRPPRRGGGAAP